MQNNLCFQVTTTFLVRKKKRNHIYNNVWKGEEVGKESNFDASIVTREFISLVAAGQPHWLYERTSKTIDLKMNIHKLVKKYRH